MELQTRQRSQPVQVPLIERVRISPIWTGFAVSSLPITNVIPANWGGQYSALDGRREHTHDFLCPLARHATLELRL